MIQYKEKNLSFVICFYKADGNSFHTTSVVIKCHVCIIYFTSITHKALGTYIRVLEDADVGVMWSNVVEETGKPGVNYRTWTSDHCPVT